MALAFSQVGRQDVLPCFVWCVFLQRARLERCARDRDMSESCADGARAFAVVMLFYDIAITFGDEVEKIWKQRFTGATVLWFMVSTVPDARLLCRRLTAVSIGTRTATSPPSGTSSLSFVRNRDGRAPSLPPSPPPLTSVPCAACTAFHDPSWSKATCQRYVLYPEALKIVTSTAIGRAYPFARARAY